MMKAPTPRTSLVDEDDDDDTDDCSWEHAMRALVPPDSRLFHALQFCPHIVQHESHPQLFLRFEDYHIPNAAARWTKFWELRVELFGPERAYCSLEDWSSGKGALVGPALELLASGVVLMLPEKDKDGNSIGFWDRSVVPSTVERSIATKDRLQVAFYNFTVMMRSNPDFVLIYRPFHHPSPAFMQTVKNRFLTTFPIRIHRAHVIVELAPSSPTSLRVYLITVFARMMMSVYSAHMKVTIDVGYKEEILQKLLSYGYSIDTLPESIGGTSMVRHFFSEWASQKVQQHSVHDETITTSAGEESCEALMLLANAAEIEKQSTESSSLRHDENNNTTIEKRSSSQQLSPADMARMPAYLRACSSSLVAKEGASYATFLALENGNTEAACSRTEAYWSFRETTFQDHLELRLSGGGALTLTDLQVLEHGYITLLPPDKQNRPVLCCDASRLERDYTEECLHCFWFMIVAAIQQKQQHECCLLIVMNKLSFERTRWHPHLVTLLQVAPVSWRLHIVRQPARLGEKMFAQKVVPVLKQQFSTVDCAMEFHCGTRTSSLMDQLQSHGFQKENLPRSLGGGWSYEHFLAWRLQREQKEQQQQQEFLTI